MKKTLTINLGGLVFNIDDDAFVVLKGYLDTIKGYFDSSEGRDEIMTDIESRIAEMLQEKMHGGKEVINSNDINEVISVMGQPEDYITEDMEEEVHTSTSSQSHSNQKRYSHTKRRLFRDTDDGMIGGVASGIGYYFGIDPLWIRLLLVVAFFAGLSGGLIYIILWIIMPEARTSSEKLAMRGEPVTFDNIGKTVEEEIQNVKKKLNNLDGDRVRKHSKSIHSTFSHLGHFVLSILKFALKAIGKILGFFFILFGGMIFISLIFGTFAPINNVFFDSGDQVIGYNLMELSSLFFSSGMDFWLSILGAFLLIGIPFLALLFVGFVLLFNAKIPRYTGLAMAAAWILGIILTGIGGLRTVVDFSKDSSVSEVTTLNHISSDTLYFDILDNKQLVKKSSDRHRYDDFFVLRDGKLTMDGIEVDVLRSNSKNSEIEIIKSASGSSFEDADQRASYIDFMVEQDSNIIKINPYFNIDMKDKWRDQGVKVNLYLPVGKTVFIPKSYKYLIYDIENYHDTHDRNMIELYWTMTDSGLVSPKILAQDKIDFEDIERDELRRLEEQIETEVEKLEVKITTDDEEHSITIK
jgi:phage shock protein PspC (stress-responsive transcriptional regulator)